jgi:hypothetical protein
VDGTFDRKPTNQEPSWLELESVKSLGEAEEITNLSRDTLKRRYRKYIINCPYVGMA